MTLILASLGTDLLTAVVGALVAVLAAGVIGARLTYRWDEMRRLRESDHAAREAFYAAYAQFFTTWKQWETVKRGYPVGPKPTDINWQLLCDASKAEGDFEALLVKLASERELDSDSCVLARKLSSGVPVASRSNPRRQAFELVAARRRKTGT